jgi:hypothetical protein
MTVGCHIEMIHKKKIKKVGAIFESQTKRHIAPELKAL